MAQIQLLADSGATKAEWCLLKGSKKKILFTQGISPYFMNTEQIVKMLNEELKPHLKREQIDVIHYYGTGCSNPDNIKSIRKALKQVFTTTSKIHVDHDLMGAARALCKSQKGIACILGTGSNSCYYNGKKIVKNSPGLGYVLGDEGSGAYLGRKVLQHFLYNSFDEELMARFNARFKTNQIEILDKVTVSRFPTDTWLLSLFFFPKTEDII